MKGKPSGGMLSEHTVSVRSLVHHRTMASSACCERPLKLAHQVPNLVLQLVDARLAVNRAVRWRAGEHHGEKFKRAKPPQAHYVESRKIWVR